MMRASVHVTITLDRASGKSPSDTTALWCGRAAYWCLLGDKAMNTLGWHCGYALLELSIMPRGFQMQCPACTPILHA